MNNSMQRNALALLSTLLVIIPLNADARSYANRQTTKDFRELIVKGERPEITACMVAAINYVRNDTKFEAMRWADEDSETAIMRETESNGHLLRNIHFKAQLRSRKKTFFDDWQQMVIICEQRDEESPEVQVTGITR